MLEIAFRLAALRREVSFDLLALLIGLDLLKFDLPIGLSQSFSQCFNFLVEFVGIHTRFNPHRAQRFHHASPKKFIS